MKDILLFNEKQLAAEIEKHNRLYWEDNTPQISDEEYDSLIQRLEELNPDHQLLRVVGSPEVASIGKVEMKIWGQVPAALTGKLTEPVPKSVSYTILLIKSQKIFRKTNIADYHFPAHTRTVSDEESLLWKSKSDRFIGIYAIFGCRACGGVET